MNPIPKLPPLSPRNSPEIDPPQIDNLPPSPHSGSLSYKQRTSPILRKRTSSSEQSNSSSASFLGYIHNTNRAAKLASTKKPSPPLIFPIECDQNKAALIEALNLPSPEYHPKEQQRLAKRVDTAAYQSFSCPP